MTDDPRIDDYLAGLPAEQRDALQRLREQVREAAPDATETISYGMPAFKLDGRFLVSFAGWKAHSSLYPLTDRFLEQNRAALEGYERTKGSIHFTPAKPLADGIVAALVRSRIEDLAAGDR